MTDRATSQADNIVPARRGEIIALAVDSTARAYDISGLTFGGVAARVGQIDELFVTFHADGGDVYFHFSDATHSDLDDTAKVAAGSPLAFSNAYAAKLLSGTYGDFRIKRTKDKFLIVKSSSGNSATLRFWASSQPAAGAP